MCVHGVFCNLLYKRAPCMATGSRQSAVKSASRVSVQGVQHHVPTLLFLRCLLAASACSRRSSSVGLRQPSVSSIEGRRPILTILVRDHHDLVGFLASDFRASVQWQRNDGALETAAGPREHSAPHGSLFTCPSSLRQ
jgi:hypothetical protein